MGKGLDARFSPIEERILDMIALEASNKEIALTLNYSQRNIEYHISKMMKRHNVQTRVGLVVKAYSFKLKEDSRRKVM
ncbi:response regulator transcription factor [Halobacillus sp. A5]|uniref:response regulator transcription factor n=1 Tax=Halobacillus sp. A5 TaxID=2880263 RepID=UPI0020A63E54|nr:helix-turn-helix transcriptional regulator [Halobacillus sp. A5]MCP3029624.1 helix-turn-helix transcriptional regulator [Halobacillus sp. A5]